jgi:hypothetical protein
MVVEGKGKLEIVDGVRQLRPYVYLVYRHGGRYFDRDGRSHIKTPRKCTVKVGNPKNESP